MSASPTNTKTTLPSNSGVSLFVVLQWTFRIAMLSEEGVLQNSTTLVLTDKQFLC